MVFSMSPNAINEGLSLVRPFAVALVLLMLCPIAMPAMSENSRTGGGVYESKAAGVVPTIDGTLSAGEWAAANSTPITLNGFSSPGTTNTATWYWMNDHDNVYIAVSFTSATDFLVLDFDVQHNHNATNGGEDYIKIQTAFTDLYWNNGAGDWSDDTSAGGTKDGSGARSTDRKVYEVSKPLNSGDTHDLNISSGDTVGFRIETFIAGDYFRFPQNTVDHDLNTNGTMWDEMKEWLDLVTLNVPPNAAPALTNGGVTPTAGNNTTMFEYYVTYTDADNDAPTNSSVLIDGTKYMMTAAATNYAVGVRYNYSTTLTAGTHNYNFSFCDGHIFVKLPGTGNTAGPDVEALLPPVLNNATVTPATGAPDSVFTFKVRYVDANNDPPVLKQAFVDGTAHVMTTTDLTYVDGSEFTYAMPLANGTHTYHFLFSDNTGQVRLPSTGELSGPIVSFPNRPPVLSNGTVAPATGSHSVNFTFTVDYVDPDGTAPSFVALLVGDQNRTMASTNGKRYTCLVKLDPGAPGFAFIASDGTFQDRSPATGFLTGPVVENAAPVAVIDEGAGPFYTKEGIVFRLNATKSSDSDKDVLAYEWLSDVDGIVGNEVRLATDELTVGAHDITLTVSDPFDLNTTLTVTVVVAALAPNLMVSNITPTNMTPKEGDLVTFQITITNHGDAQSMPTNLTWTLDGKDITSVSLKNILPNDGTDMELKWKALPGDHTIGYRLFDLEGSYTITVAPNEPPTAALAGPVDGVVNSQIAFSAANSTDPEGKPLSYSWNFGDGETATGASVIHIYKKSGTFNVTLTVTDDLGTNSTSTTTVVVKGEGGGKKKNGIPGFEAIASVTAVVAVMVALKKKRN